MKKTTNFCIQFSVYDKYAIIIFVYNYNKFPFVYINTCVNKILNFLFYTVPYIGNIEKLPILRYHWLSVLNELFIDSITIN